MPIEASKRLASGNIVRHRFTVSEDEKAFITISYDQSPSDEDKTKSHKILKDVAALTGFTVVMVC